MTEETKTENNVDQQKSEETKSTKAETKVEAKTSEQKKEEPKVESKKEEPKEDPTLSRLLAAERRLEEMQSELEDYRSKVKTYEREGRKSSILTALADAFPGLPRDEIRGAALVAAEDGRVDLFSSDTKAQVEKMRELLKAKKPSVPQPSLGGTPGSPAKPQVGTRDPKNLRWQV